MALGAVEEFDAIVVGSGFGGSVMTHRLVEAGWKVCLLERGRKWPPGSFARTPRAFRENFWDPSEGLFGLYDIWSFRKLDAVISSGLGGGSLIYANVLLRKDEKWFVREKQEGHGGHEYWPVTRADLDLHYDRVEKVLKPTPFPMDHHHFQRVRKSRAFLEAGRAAGFRTELAPLAITFGNDPNNPVPGEEIREPPNLHGLPRSTCRMCGECYLGCNYGSKNTLDYTYLSDAARMGADIRELCEVKEIKKRSGVGFEIVYTRHDPEAAKNARPGAYEPECRTMICKKLILSAGSLGSSYLLLKNRDSIGALSTALGDRVGGNGDALVFAVDCRDEKGDLRELHPDVGPTITVAARRPDSLDGERDDAGRGGYVQEASIAPFITWLGEFGLPWKVIPNVARFAWMSWRSHRKDADMSYEITKLFGNAQLSRGLLPLLCMGRDVPDGRYSMNGKWLTCDWTDAASSSYFEGMRAMAATLVKHLGGRFAESPAGLIGRTTTVHPLGGVPMGSDPAIGAVDEWGRVYGTEDLIVADGSVLPGPTGPNPALTIAALADRFADHLIAGGHSRPF